MTKNFENNEIISRLDQLLALIKRAVPPEFAPFQPDKANAFLYKAETKYLQPITDIQPIDLDLLQNIEQAKITLLENTTRFAKGFAANNALLWGARGMGKSSLVKAVCAKVNESHPLKLIEIQRQDIANLIELLDKLRHEKYQFILFCDDLSFEQNDSTYKALKATLEGGILGRATNCLFYATSNRRHLMPRDIIENEQANAINPDEAVQEKISLSDRFGLWLGFHKCNQDEYLAMVKAYFHYYDLGTTNELPDVFAQAIEWAAIRGNRSGRIAFQFITDLAGKRQKKI